MEKPTEHLKRILELLGPNLFLEMDAAAFPRFFGGEIGRESAEIEAMKLADENDCSFRSDGKTARFGRAYPARKRPE